MQNNSLTNINNNKVQQDKLSTQMSTQKKILIMNMLVTIAIMINYALIGAVTGMILNIVCVVRNLIFINRDKKIFSYKFYPYLLMLPRLFYVQ